MKKTLLLCVLLFIVLPTLHAQIENISTDSIGTYLCKKWKEKARFLNRTQIQIFGEPFVYEFKTDSSFTRRADGETTVGKWTYHADKKVIELFIAGKNHFYIVSIGKKEMLFSADLLEESKKGMGILVLLWAEG